MNIQMEKGMGKEKNFLKNGKIKYDGEYLDGEIWNGKGKIFDYYRNISFEGKYHNSPNKSKKILIISSIREILIINSN